MVREFYASYSTTVTNALPPRAKALTQLPLLTTMVWGLPVDLFETTICHFIYGPSHCPPINTTEYDYRMGIIQGRAFRDSEQRESLLCWMALYIAEDRERTEWIQNMQLPIRKATLSLGAKFWWSIIRHRLSPTQADNVDTYDRVVMLATLVAGLEHFHRLVEVTKTVDVGLIQDDANPPALRRSTSVTVPPVGANLVHEKLETQMATLLQHMRPWMQRSIKVSEAQMERMMDAKIQVVHRRLNIFELRVMERPRPTIEITSFQMEFARLHYDVDALLTPVEAVVKTTP
uniref:Integrase core domain containing protein n=1 Tax=Solanum tuberosum TaxID=4113 RepID=M1DKZ4_SOLTU